MYIIFNMINTEILAITAIFTSGFYVGFKIKQGLYNLNDYIQKRKRIE